MIGGRLLRKIEMNWARIAIAVTVARNHDPDLPHYRNLSDEEIHERLLDLTKNFIEWTNTKDDSRLAAHFESLGRRRYAEQIPLHEVIQKLTMIKRAIRTYASEQNYFLTATEIYNELELIRTMESYFEFVVVRVAKGYEEAMSENTDWDPGRFRLRGSRKLQTA